MLFWCYFVSKTLRSWDKRVFRRSEWKWMKEWNERVHKFCSSVLFFAGTANFFFPTWRGVLGAYTDKRHTVTHTWNTPLKEAERGWKSGATPLSWKSGWRPSTRREFEPSGAPVAFFVPRYWSWFSCVIKFYMVIFRLCSSALYPACLTAVTLHSPKVAVINWIPFLECLFSWHNIWILISLWFTYTICFNHMIDSVFLCHSKPQSRERREGHDPVQPQLLHNWQIHINSVQTLHPLSEGHWSEVMCTWPATPQPPSPLTQAKNTNIDLQIKDSAHWSEVRWTWSTTFSAPLCLAGRPSPFWSPPSREKLWCVKPPLIVTKWHRILYIEPTQLYEPRRTLTLAGPKIEVI